jgi:hypothetical protein
MSYLLENSKVIPKSVYLDEEEKYLSYQTYPIEDHIIITENTRPFFSIYDIANYCKKKHKDSKLFLIVHRFFDKMAGVKITEFYILNTVNIFDKSLTSCLLVKASELLAKQHVIQDNLNIAMNLLNTNQVHIILGDNVKEHEVEEFISEQNGSVELFDSEIQFLNKDTVSSREDIKIKSTRISSILKSIRIIEPQSKKVQKNILILVIILLSVYMSDEYMYTLFDDDIRKEKKEKRNIEDKLRKVKKDVSFKEDIYGKDLKVIKELSKKEIYIPKSK